jgi:hypothetical protein
MIHLTEQPKEVDMIKTHFSLLGIGGCKDSTNSAIRLSPKSGFGYRQNQRYIP